MLNKYEQILKESGEEAAKDYMRSVRAKVKTIGLANLTKKQRTEVTRKGWATRRANKASKGLQEEVRPVSK